jgi:hypothetical protein
MDPWSVRGGYQAKQGVSRHRTRMDSTDEKPPPTQAHPNHLTHYRCWVWGGILCEIIAVGTFDGQYIMETLLAKTLCQSVINYTTHECTWGFIGENLR